MLYPEVLLFINFVLGWFSNGLLIFLILRHSPKSMANYKYLMLIFAIFGVIFGAINITCQPLLHFHQSGYTIFSKNPLHLPRNLAFWYSALDAACLGSTLCLLSFHFVYRFLTVCKPDFLWIFEIPHSIIPTVIFITVSAEWCLVTYLLAGESPLKTEYFKNSIYSYYGVTETEYAYIAVLFYRTDPSSGSEFLSLPDCAIVLNLFLIITAGFSVIFYCWYRIHHRLKRFNNLSSKTLEIQTQLFRALVIQTLFPVFFLFIPSGIIFLLSLFKIEPGPAEGVFLSLITTQPFIDAVIPMYFIKSYRSAIRTFFERTNGVESGTVWVSRTDEKTTVVTN